MGNVALGRVGGTECGSGSGDQPVPKDLSLICQREDVNAHISPSSGRYPSGPRIRQSLPCSPASAHLPPRLRDGDTMRSFPGGENSRSQSTGTRSAVCPNRAPTPVVGVQLTPGLGPTSPWVSPHPCSCSLGQPEESEQTRRASLMASRVSAGQLPLWASSPSGRKKSSFSMTWGPRDPG